jgi:hypothetical protein
MSASRIVAFCLAVSLATQIAAAQSAPGLLGQWKFDRCQGTVAADSSGNGNAGDIVGAEWAQGEFGGALHFTGSESCVSVP